MNQVVVQDFQLDRIPQAAPRPTEDPAQKLPPQLPEGRFNPLLHLTEQEFVGGNLVTGNQQHLRLLGQWVMHKYTRFKGHKGRAKAWLAALANREPGLFAHWELGKAFTAAGR